MSKEQERLQREELERLGREHQKTLEKEKREKEKKKTPQRKPSKPTEEEQQRTQQEKESLLDTLHSVVNGYKPSKPKDLGWDYLKDKEAKRVFERKKELQKLREKERERKSRYCPECKYLKHPGPCPCKICGKKDHKIKDCPKSKPPKKVPEPAMDFCTECMVPHPPGKCICKLCKSIGHLATEYPWLKEAQDTAKPPEPDKEDKEPSVPFCLHCRSDTHKMEDCAAHKVAQAKMKKLRCENCKQYGHTIAECLDEKQEQRNREIEREIKKRKQQLKEIDKKMEQVRRQAERDVGEPPQVRILGTTPQKQVGDLKLSLNNKIENLNHHHLPWKVHPQVHQQEQEEEEGHQEEMNLVNLMSLIQMKMMKRNQMNQKPQKSQDFCMMKWVEK